MRPSSKPSGIAIVLCVAGVHFSAGAQTVMQPGAWEMTMQMSAMDPATRAMKKMGESSTRVCLTTSFLAKDPYLNPNADASDLAQSSGKCATSNYQRNGNSASWRMDCTLGDGSQMTARISNSAASESVTMDMRQEVKRPAGSGYALIATQMSFIGACTADMPVL